VYLNRHSLPVIASFGYYTIQPWWEVGVEQIEEMHKNEIFRSGPYYCGADQGRPDQDRRKKNGQLEIASPL